jgi:hypothetical protein
LAREPVSTDDPARDHSYGIPRRRARFHRLMGMRWFLPRADKSEGEVMLMRHSRLSLGIGAAAVLWLLAAPLAAQEHPEHPKGEHPQEMTLDQLATAITDYIARDSKLKGGPFLVYDAVDKKPLQLELVLVHKDRLSSLGEGVYFACTDMKATDGTVYDLDFFMKKGDAGVETTEVSIHKKAGAPRYGWKEEAGVWKKVKS